MATSHRLKRHAVYNIKRVGGNSLAQTLSPKPILDANNLTFNFLILCIREIKSILQLNVTFVTCKGIPTFKFRVIPKIKYDFTYNIKSIT